jgi:hypothetical protein
MGIGDRVKGVGGRCRSWHEAIISAITKIVKWNAMAGSRYSCFIERTRSAL